MDRKNVAALVVVAVLFGFLLGRLSTRIGGFGGRLDLARFVQADPGELASASELLPISDAPFVGNGAAKVTMVLFTEFQCPFSRRVLGSLIELLGKYEADELRLVFMNYPLPFHELAMPAAVAALAAHEQGQFWAYHDLLFNNQNRFDPESLQEYAEELDLRMDEFRAALDSDEYAERIANEQGVGTRLGVRGTPSFLINGELVVGAKSAGELMQIIDAEIEQADALLAAGVPLTEIHRVLVEERVEATAEDRSPGPRELTAEADSSTGTVARPIETVELAVFADFTNPRYRPLGLTLARLTSELGDRLGIDYTSVVDADDTHAVLVAAALRAAQEQDRWITFHAALADRTDTVDRETLLAIAETIGLDQESFREALDSPSSAQLARAELEAAQRRGVVATPAVFIGGRRFVGSLPYDDLRELIDAELTQR